MSSLASESVSVGTFWNSPSLRLAVASSSPVGFSRNRDVGGGAAMAYERVGLEMVVGGKAGVEGGTLEGRLRRYLGF